jgi:hypothetical protein
MRQRRERGAAVFVVVLVIALLTGLGLFAVRSATTAIAASGYNRQLNQTHYVADMAIIGTVALGGDNPEAVKQLMMRGPDTAGGDVKCTGYDQQVSPTCMLVSYDDINARVTQANAGNKLIEELGRSPLTGVPLLDADMRIELTDLHPARPVRGHEVAGGSGAGARLRFAHVTVTATGLVRPAQTTSGTWDTQSATAAGIEAAQAHVIIGPVSF